MMRPLIAHRTEDGRVRVATSPHLSCRPGAWTMTADDAKLLAAQLLAATVEDEKFQEGRSVGAAVFDCASRVRKLVGGR